MGDFDNDFDTKHRKFSRPGSTSPRKLIYILIALAVVGLLVARHHQQTAAAKEARAAMVYQAKLAAETKTASSLQTVTVAASAVQAPGQIAPDPQTIKPGPELPGKSLKEPKSENNVPGVIKPQKPGSGKNNSAEQIKPEKTPLPGEGAIVSPPGNSPLPPSSQMS